MKGPVFFRTLLPICCFLLMAPLFSAGSLQAASGEITGIASSGDLTVRISDPIKLKAGDTIVISYMAGVMEMLIGTYRVTDTNDKDGVTLRPLSISIPPSKGMRVIVSVEPPSNILPVQK